MAPSRQTMLLLLVAATALRGGLPAVPAQTKEQAAERSAAVCDRQRALELVGQQAAEAREIDRPVARIGIMIRAADLLWPHQEEAARATFAQAYDLAVKYFNESGEENRIENGLLIMIPDQRFLVMSAISRRDPAWAKRLAERSAEETRREAEKAQNKRSTPEEVSDKLLGLASSLLKVDKNVAQGLARSSFRYPASYTLPAFLLSLADSDRQAADRLFREALAAYANATTEELIYLAIYPFALNRVVGPVKISMYYTPPPNFAGDPSLQLPLVEALLRRAGKVLQAPEQPPATEYAAPETAQLHAALSSLEPLVAQSLPALAQKFAVVRAMAGASMSERARERASAFLQQQRAEVEGEYGFERSLEKAERENDPARRDQAIAFAIMHAPDTESLERMEELARRVGDETLRHGLLDWLYFKSAQKATKDGLFDDAARMAEKVRELEYRALLSFEIASEAIKRLDDRARATELLEAVLKLAHQAPETGAKARAFLGVSYLFARFDPARATEALGAAVKTINRLPELNFSSEWIQRQVKGKTFTIYTGYNVPGFNLENAFRELGAHDFEGALSLARAVKDGPLRATAVLALSARCLEDAQRPDKSRGNPAPSKGTRKPAKAIKESP